MKKLFFYISIISLCALIISCNKDVGNPKAPEASITVVNAGVDLSSVSMTFSLTPIPFYLQLLTVPYGTFVEDANPAGPTPLTLISANDTTHSVFKGTIKTVGGGLYTLYLIGQIPNIDTLLTKDNIPPAYADSLAGVRFINLSPDSKPISINLQGNYPGGATEFTSVGYKQLTSFKTYAATSKITSYNFEIRDAATGTLLTTFTWDLFRFRNHTLVIDGLENDASGNDPINVFSVQNF